MKNSLCGSIIGVILFIGSFILLFLGAQILVKSSVTLSERLNIPKLIIGLTIVSLATSLPEFFITLKASLSGNNDFALGNIIGSNITNIGLVLGITSLFSPIFFSFDKIRYDLYFLGFITFLPLIFIYLGDLIFWQGVFFFFLLFLLRKIFPSASRRKIRMGYFQ